MLSQNINLTTNKKPVTPTVHMVQGDSGRKLVCTVYDYTSASSGALAVELPSGTVYSSAGTISTASDHITFSVDITSDMLAEKGLVKGTVKLYDTSSKLISSHMLYIDVEESAGLNKPITPSNDKVYVVINGQSVELAKQPQVDTLQTDVTNLKEDFSNISQKAINVFNHYELVNGYYYHNSGSSNTATTAKKIPSWIRIYAGRTYYYKNLYAYFCNIKYDTSSTWQAISENTDVNVEGKFIAEGDGYIVLSIYHESIDKALFTDCKDMLINNIFEDAFFANKLYIGTNSILDYADNILEEIQSRNTGYYYHNSTAIKATSVNYNYPPIRIYKDKVYYYNNVYRYFTNIVYDGENAIALTNDAVSVEYGEFTAEKDGYLFITCADGNMTSILTTDKNYILQSINDSKIANIEGEIPKIFYVGAGRQYSRIRDAVYEAKKYKNSTVYIDAGTYDLCSEFANEISNSQASYYGIGLANDIKLIFSPKAYVTALYNGTDTNVLTYFCPFYPLYNAGGFEIHNLNIKAKNTRYCVHDELGGSTITHRKVIYKNCNMEYENTINSTYTQCIGGGLGKESIIDIINCKFNAKSGSIGVSYHNNTAGDSKSIISIRNCIFADTNTIQFISLGNNPQQTECYVSGNRLGTSPICDNSNMVMYAFCNEIVN